MNCPKWKEFRRIVLVSIRKGFSSPLYPVFGGFFQRPSLRPISGKEAAEKMAPGHCGARYYWP
jgi:hypothetical protein